MEARLKQELPVSERIERTVKCTTCHWYTPGVPQAELIRSLLDAAALHETIATLREDATKAAEELARLRAINVELVDTHNKVVIQRAREAEELERVREESDKEAGRWQDAIYKLLVKETDDSIDGGGCDSGDPLDFTISEISQAIGILKEELARERERHQDLVEKIAVHVESESECLMAIVLDETRHNYGVRLLNVMADELRKEFAEPAPVAESSKDGQ